jgi:hypothetical protein
MNCESLNIVGLSLIEYVSVRALSSFQVFRKTDGNLGGTIALQNGHNWQNLSTRYTDADKRYWTESPNLNAAQGDSFDNRIVDLLPGISSDVQWELEDMQRDRFIVRFEDASGRKFILGSPNFPLRFKSSYDSKQALHQTEFFGNQPHKALIWNF